MLEYKVVFQMRNTTVRYESILPTEHVDNLIRHFRKRNKPVFTILNDAGMSMAINLADCCGITWTEIK